MRGVPLYALLTQRQWALVFICGVTAACGGLPFSNLSLWVPSGFALAGMTLCHMVLSSRFCLPLPQTAILIATVYYLFAPIVTVYYPARNPLYTIHDVGAYFSYAVPCLWATAMGWSFAFYRSRPHAIAEQVLSSDPRLYSGLDLMIVGGLFFALLSSALELPRSLIAVFGLAANVRYIGVFGWVLMGRTGWKLRLVTVLAIDLYASVATGFFLNFLLWSVNVAVVVIYRYRIPYWKTFIIVCIGILLLPCLQYAKWELRKSTWGVIQDQQKLMVFGEFYSLNRFNKPVLLIAKVVESSYDLITGRQTQEFIADTAVRYNQAWIVARILSHVPLREEYANGETVVDSIVAALVPRALMPDKMQWGGQGTFTRFTGIVLNSTTSMNLGFIGEMYANYGRSGGIIGCGVYAMFFGLIFRWLNARSRVHVIMLSFMPYILNFAVVSEVGLLEVLNYTIKSMWVAIAIYYATPAVFSRVSRYTSPSVRTNLR